MQSKSLKVTAWRAFAVGIAVVLFAGAGAAQGASASAGQHLSFEEQFALSSDRKALLSQLIPGSEDSYYYTCLERQHAGDLAAIDDLVRAWTERHGRGKRVVEIENRQALLRFETDPQSTWEYLRQYLPLNFNHQREVPGEKPNLPTRLDPNLVSAAAWARRALERHTHSADGFRGPALKRLAEGELDDDLLTSLLQKLQQPDVANLPALVVRQLKLRRAGEFGALAIHRKLTLPQLEDCARLEPELLGSRAFVDALLVRLAPSADADTRRDPAARLAHLERLAAFVQSLSSAFNSLKAHVLYQRLAYDLAAGKPDLQRFRAYLKLPRRSNGATPRPVGRSEDIVDLSQQFPTGCPVVGDDAPLVLAYLAHFLRDAEDSSAFADDFEPRYLARAFAQIKILAGVGDMERWYSLLDDADAYEELKQRVELNFPWTQPQWFAADAPVALELDVKNVTTLLVKIYEIHALNYYTEEKREIDASLALDGLVANHELSFEYTESPLRRVRRRFEFPQLARPGVYVVEFIGNGSASRAVVHKGALQLVERVGSAGHVFRVLDETGASHPKAVLHFEGRSFAADERGDVLLPFTTAPGTKPLILEAGERVALASFEHRAESYALACGAYVEREALRSGERAKLIVRPYLSLHGRAASLKLLEEPVLSITSTDRDGVESSLDVRAPQFAANDEYVQEIAVPDRLAQLRVRLRGHVTSLTTGQPIELSSQPDSFELNRIEPTAQTDCPLLGRAADGWFLDVLGKSGEPRAHRALTLQLVHRDFTDPLEVALQTDAAGRVRLGALDGVKTLAATGFPDGQGTWRLDRERRTQAPRVHGVAGSVLRIPYATGAQRLERGSVSLFELRADDIARDAYDHVKLVNGALELSGLSAGEYLLELNDLRQSVSIGITAGTARDGWAYGRSRVLELGAAMPLHVSALRTDSRDFVVQFAGAGPDARVHVFATRYLPAYDPFDSIGLASVAELREVELAHPDSEYRAGREIGDEFRYILERRFAHKYPGNLLHRPGLLLNPWEIEESDTHSFGGAAPSAIASRRVGSGGKGRRALGVTRARDLAQPGVIANLDFLGGPTSFLANLRPGADGSVRIPLADLGAGQHVHVIALDARERIYASLALAEQPLQPRDQRLSTALDSARHLAERRAIDFVQGGAALVIDEGATAGLQTYDSLDDVYAYFRTRSGDAELERFAFLVRWPSLPPEEQRALYSEHACHELHFFLYHKDRAFFDAVVRPYLANKFDKTFLDRWLLDEPLERYLDPWAFEQLNIVERILLARRQDTAAGARHVRELFELEPPDLAGDEQRFATALAGSALSAETSSGTYKGAGDTVPPGGPATPGAAGPVREEAKSRADKDEAANADQMLADSADPNAAELLEQDSDALQRKQVQRLYVPVAGTKTLAEHNYWHHRSGAQDASLINVNAYWRDYAAAPSGQPFVSTHFTVATKNVAEMLLALSVLDLPFTAGEHTLETAPGRRTLRAASPLLAVRKELRDSPPAAHAAPLLVSQDCFRLDDRHEYVDSEQRDKFVRDEFLAEVAYGCRVVVTNPTSSTRELELLLQVPAGSVPLMNGRRTHGQRVRLAAYGTESIEYAFYFPRPGRFAHYPVHVTQSGELVAYAVPATFNVVAEPSTVDRTSWEYVSQRGSTADVFAFLADANLQRLALGRIAWRMQERGTYDAVLALLRQRMRFEPTLWSYALLYADTVGTREYLRWLDGFLDSCGPYLDSPLVTIDPVERRAYEHLEFDPLVNARAHPLGRTLRIPNANVSRQYEQLLAILAHRPKLDDHDWLSVTYFLLLQDRVEEALAAFAKVDPKRIDSRIQYDYLQAYLDFYSDEHALARGIAERYREHPVARWRALFADVRSQLDEAAGAAPVVSDARDRDQSQGALAASEPALGLELEGRSVKLAYRNLASCEISYYPMDIEFLFSANPFVGQDSRAFAFIRPRRTDTVVLPAGQPELALELPAELRSANVLVEVRAGGLVRRKPCLQGSLRVQWLQNYGQLAVTQAASAKPLPKVYVKVYARDSNGIVRFHKDGYTDLRGRFDYASLSGSEAVGAARFAILVASDTDGAVIGEIDPPAQ
jgi:hypothetical protein